MKFFDLETDGLLAGGGRDVSFAQGKDCTDYLFTHGNTYNACAHNDYKFPIFNINCGRHTKPINNDEK